MPDLFLGIMTETDIGNGVARDIYGSSSTMETTETLRVKHPRIKHLPWSRGFTDDDKVLPDCRFFTHRKVVVTVKYDGENTSLYRDYLHARSINETHHPSRGWIKNLHAQISYNIPEGWRICGENLYAKHTIHYKHLPTYFLVHSIWNEKNECLSWDDTTVWVGLLGLQKVPTLYIGEWDEKKIRNLCPDEFNGDECEGLVVRFAENYKYDDAGHCVAKFVREKFRERLDQGSSHWKHKVIVPNELNSD